MIIVLVILRCKACEVNGNVGSEEGRARYVSKRKVPSLGEYTRGRTKIVGRKGSAKRCRP